MSGKRTEQDDEDNDEIESDESEESEEGESTSDEGGNNSEDMDTYFKDIGKMLYYSFFKNMEQNLKSQNLHGKSGKHSKKSHRGKQKAKRKPTTGFDGNVSPMESVQQNTYQSVGEGKLGVSDLDDLSPSISHKVVNVDQMIAEKSTENNDSSLETFPGRKQMDDDTDINSLSPSIPHKVIPLNELIAEKKNISLDTCEIGINMNGSDQAAHTDGLLHEHSHQARIQGDVPSVGSDKTRGFKDGNTSTGNENTAHDIGQIVEEIQNSGPESRKGLERYFSRGRSQKNLSGYQTQNDNLDSLPTDESLEPSSSVNVGKTSFPNTSGNLYQNTSMGKYAEGNYLEMRLRGALPHKKKILMESLARNADATGGQFGVDSTGTTTGHYGKNGQQGESYSNGMVGKGNTQQHHRRAERNVEDMQSYHKFPVFSEHFQPSAVSNANFSSTSPVSNTNTNLRLTSSQPENVSVSISDEVHNQKEKNTDSTVRPEKEVKELEEYLHKESCGSDCMKRLENIYGKGVKKYIPSPPGKDNIGNGRVIMLGDDGAVIDVTDQEYFNSDHVKTLNDLSRTHYTTNESYENAVSVVRDLLRCNFVKPECSENLVSVFGSRILEDVGKDTQSDGHILSQLNRVSEGDTAEGSNDGVIFTGQHFHQNPQDTLSSYGTVPVASDLHGTGVHSGSLTSVERGHDLQTESNLNPTAVAEDSVHSAQVDEFNKYLQEGTCGQKCLKRMEDVHGKGVKSYIPPHPEMQMNQQGRVVTLGEDDQVIDVTEEENASKEDLDNVMDAIFKDHTTKESYDKGISEIKDYLSRNAVLPGCKKRLEVIYGKGIIDAFEDEAHLNKVLKAMDENDQNENATCKNSSTSVNSESSSASVHSGDNGDVTSNNSLNVDINRTHDSEGVEICMGLLSSLEVSGLGMNENETGIDQTKSYHTRNVQSEASPLSRDVTKPTSQKRRFHQRDTPQRLSSYDSSSDHRVTPLESSIASVSSTDSDFLPNSQNQTSLVDNSIATPISGMVRSMPCRQSTDTNNWVFSDNESLQTDSDITDYYPSTGESASLVTHQSPAASLTSSDSLIPQAINFIPPQGSAHAGQQFTTPVTNSELSNRPLFQSDHNSHIVMDTSSTDFDFLLNSPIIPLSPDLKMPSADGTSSRLNLPSTLQSDSLSSKPTEIHTLSNKAMSNDQNFTSIPNATDVIDNFTTADSSASLGIAGQAIDTSASHRFGDISSSFQISQPSSSYLTTQITHSNVGEVKQTGDENGSRTQSTTSSPSGIPQTEPDGRYFPVTFPLDDHSFQTFTSLNPDSPSFFADTANLPQSPLKVPETLNESNSLISISTSKQPELATSQPNMTHTTLQAKPQSLSEHLSKTVNPPAVTTTAEPNQAQGFYASSLLLSLIPKASEATISPAAPRLRVLSANSSTPADAVTDTIQSLHSRKRYSSAGNSSVASPSLAVASTQQMSLPSSAGISTSLATASKGFTGRSSSSQQDRKLPPCRICGEKASGYHFGVNSCEACNEFYRRTLKQNKIYFCARDGNCDVSGAKRNSCSFCRFQRCVKAGMSRDRIKTGRYSHKKRTLDALELKQLDEKNRPSLDANLLDQKIDHLQNLYSGFCTLEKLSEGSNMVDDGPASFGGNSFYDTGHSPAKCPFVENTLPFFFPKSNVEDFVREFLRLARGIPGFSSLCSQDQTALSRKSWVEFWMLSEFSATSSDIQIPTHPEIILLLSDECKNVMGAEFVRSMTHCCNRTRAMNLSRTVFLLMKVLVVTSPDCVMLVNKNEVENLNWLYVQCLLHELGKSSSQGVFGTERRSSDHGQMFTEIMDVLNELRTIVRSYEKVLSPSSVQALFQ